MEIDFYDFQNAVYKVIDLLDELCNKYDNVYINISSGAKPIITAVILASQYYPVNIFYIKPQKYNITEHQFLSSGVKEFVELPMFSLSKVMMPSKAQTGVLKLLADNN
jgi:hypothetical protein